MIKFERYDADRIIALRYEGTSGYASNFAQMKEFYTSCPQSVSYTHIVDIRRWSGIVTDDELGTFVSWTKEFRHDHGIDPNALPRTVYIVPDHGWSDRTPPQLTQFSRANIAEVVTTAQAFQLISPENLTLNTLEKFLGR